LSCPENAALYRRVQGQGAVVSEFPMGARPEAGSFPRRNRVISGLSLGVIIVEAPEKSGSLITAAYAAEQNREVMAVPGDIRSGRSRGCHRLLRDGAALVEGVEDVLFQLEQWLPRRPHQEVAALPQPPLVPQDQQVYGMLGAQPRHIDELAQEAKLAPEKLLEILLRLELEGLIAQQPGKHFARRAG
jgi:DNA processing protein